MEKYQLVDILNEEDNPNNAELTIRVLKSKNLTNRLFVVKPVYFIGFLESIKQTMLF